MILMTKTIQRRIGYLFSIAATSLVFGCGPKHMVIEDSTLHDANSGHLTIYRPDTFFHRYKPDEPHVFVDEAEIETLGVGERISVRLPPGEHRIVVRATLLGIPTYTKGEVRLKVEAGGEYYVRHSYDLAEFGTDGSTLYPVGRSSLSIVPAQVARREIQ